MVIDIIFLCLMGLAFFKGIKNGFIVAVFSLVGLVVGLAAALKLSAAVANYLRAEAHWDSVWLPLLSFAAVFAAAALLVRWGAMVLQKGIELAFLGWLNKIGGIVLYAVIYILLFSVILFYAGQLHWIGESTIHSSRCYGFIQPWGPVVIDGIGRFIPMFKDIFRDLEKFFEHLGQKVNEA